MTQPYPHCWARKPSELSRRAHQLLAEEARSKACPAPVATLAEGGTPGTAQIRPKYSQGFGVCWAPVLQAPVVWAAIIRLIFGDLLPGCLSLREGCALDVALDPWRPSQPRSLPFHSSRVLWVWRAGPACSATHRNPSCLRVTSGWWPLSNDEVRVILTSRLTVLLAVPQETRSEDRAGEITLELCNSQLMTI